MNAAELGDPNISPKLQTATAIAIPAPDVRIPNAAEPQPREEDAERDHPDPRVAHRDRGHAELEDHDQDPVRTLQEPVDAVWEPEVADPQGEGGVPLRVDEPARQDRGEDEEETLVGEDRGTRAAALPILLPRGAGAVGERDERDHAERRGGHGVGDEQQGEVLLGEEPSERETDREREVEQQPVERVRRDAMLRGNQIGDQRAGSGPMELGEERVHDHDRHHRGERPRLEEEQNEDGGRDHRDGDRVASPDPVGEQAAGELRDHGPDAVAGDREAGFLHGETAGLGQVEREEREDEAREPEHERAGEQDPDGTRQGPVAVPEPGAGLGDRAHRWPGRWYPETEGGTSMPSWRSGAARGHPGS